MTFRSTLFVCVSMLMLARCGTKEPQHAVDFYHWKQSFEVDSNVQQALTAFESTRIYMRVFDVVWMEKQQAAYPVSQLQAHDLASSTDQAIIPTIYITNEVLLKSNDEDVLLLADRIDLKVTETFKSLPLNAARELHLDCDWTPKTQLKFFALVRALRGKDYWARLSCTLRLHQYKYPEKTGVPPVDYATLMCYNMGELSSIEEKNSILNLETAASYLPEGRAYPLPLSVALPLFSWGIQFRGEKVIALINTLRVEDLERLPTMKELSPGVFQVLESQFLNEQYVYSNDLIRIEEVNMNDLKALIELLEQRLENPSFDIVLYHLDKDILEHYPIEKLQAIL